MNRNSVGELPFQLCITPSLMDTNTEFQRMQRKAGQSRYSIKARIIWMTGVHFNQEIAKNLTAHT